MAISANIKLMKIKIKTNWSLIIVIILAGLFFICTSSFNYLTQDTTYVKWTSPDEAANYFFTSRFTEGTSLAFFDPAAVIGENIVLPRSFRSDFGWLKPVSFLGIIIIYGTLGKIFGLAFIPFLTPLIAALGIIFFYLLIKKLFSKKIALLSSFLLAFFPVYIYYTVRSMFHNVLFVVLLIMGTYFIVLSSYHKLKKKKIKDVELEDDKEEVRQESKIFVLVNKIKKSRFFSFRLSSKRWFDLLFSFLGGLFIGLAVITRTSELLWLAPAAFVAWLFYAKRIGLIKLILIISGFFLALIPTMYFNQVLYSSPVYGGYNEMNKSIDDISKAGSQMASSVLKSKDQFIGGVEEIYNNVFYFGFKPMQSARMVKHYIWDMFPLLNSSFLVGLIIVIAINLRRPRKKYISYLLIFVLLSLILTLYYGSWKFNDNPDPNRFTIGNSYTRYWLPIYLMMMPIASLFLIRLSKALVFSFKKEPVSWRAKLSNGLLMIFISIYVAISLNFVLYGSEEGLSYLYYRNVMERGYIENVFNLTEKNGVIITQYYDKFLFPERRVIVGNISNRHILKNAAKLVKYYPVYYYNFSLKDEDILYLNDRRLAEYGLQIEMIKKINNNFSLYELKEVRNEEISN